MYSITGSDSLMAAFPRNLMNDIIVPFASSIRSFYRRSSPLRSGINERVSSRHGRRYAHDVEGRPGEERTARSEITFPPGGIVSAIYQSRCRTIKQRPPVVSVRAARRSPRRIERVGRRFDFHDKAKYPVDPAVVERYSSIGVFLVAHGRL